MERDIEEKIRVMVERAVDRKFDEFRNLWLQGHDFANFAQTFGAAARRESTLAGGSGLRWNDRGEPMQTKEEVYMYAQHLERFAKYLPVHYPDVGDIPVFAALSENVGQALLQWLESPGSRFLWVDDLLTDPQDGVLTRMSMQICNNASASQLPVALFFRRSYYSFRRENYMSAEHAGLIALLYSLILQLINVLPDSFRARPALSEETFWGLDGSLRSVQPALQILGSLLDYSTQALICVIDGLERLESSATIGAIAQLVDILRYQSRGRRFKVLFTTVGTSEVLRIKLSISEQVLASRSTRNTRGARLPGGWLHFQMSLQGPSFHQAGWFKFLHPEKIRSVQNRSNNECKRQLGVLNGILEGRECACRWSLEDRFKEFPNVKAWHERMTSRDSRNKSMAEEDLAWTGMPRGMPTYQQYLDKIAKGEDTRAKD
ncbi:hypothetical protein F4776DRAFT_672023 [Hypoxylon sp. NC0597]|nr:hypothetical protein F4776DRAFT_672023 [Hypoxylon sp. NC0597]